MKIRIDCYRKLYDHSAEIGHLKGKEELAFKPRPPTTLVLLQKELTYLKKKVGFTYL